MKRRFPNLTERAQRRLLWLLTLLCIACGSAWSLIPVGTAAERLALVPLAAGGFVGQDVMLNERELKVLGRVDHLHREYRVGEASLYVTLIDGSRDRHAVHDPRYCFRGAGWDVLAEEKRAVPGGQATWMRAQRDGEVAEAAFWFSDGRRRHSSLARYLGTTILRRVSFGRLGGKPVLVVVQSFSPTPMEWAQVEQMVGALKL